MYRRSLLFLLALTLPALAGTTQQVSEPKTRQVPLRLMTWNVGTINPITGLRLPNKEEQRVVDLIVRERPQVVLLQEVASDTQIRRLRDALAARGLVYSYSTSIVDPRRDDGRMTGTLYMGAARDTRVLKTTSGFRAQAVVLDAGTVVNVHGPSVSHKNRKTYYAELATWARSLPQPVILAGDFNLNTKHGAGLAAVLPWQRKVDQKTFAALSTAFPVRTEVGYTTVYRLVFDHVMLTAGTIRTQRCLRGSRRLPMDHEPIVVDLVLRKRVRGGMVGAIQK